MKPFKCCGGVLLHKLTCKVVKRRRLRRPSEAVARLQGMLVRMEENSDKRAMSDTVERGKPPATQGESR